MSFAGFDDWDECIVTMTEEEGHDQSSAEQICGALQAEAKADNGSVEELKQALERGRGLIADVGVDILSGVGEPAIDSKWTMFKCEGGEYDREGTTSVVFSKEDGKADKRIAYAAAMIPRELDKEGDVVPTPTVEDAAHKYMTGDGGVDTDHSLIEGDGEAVESWILKEERTYDLPGGGSETYPAGTWMVGIKWEQEAWDRIQAGDLTGLSIYGMADSVPLGKSAPTTKQLDIPLANESIVHLVYESRTAAEKASEEIGLGGDVHEHKFDGMTVFMPGETHDDFVNRYMELSEQNSDTEETEASADDGEGGATPTNDPDESAKQNSTMTDDNPGDDAGEGDGTGDGGDTEPSLKDLEAELAELKDAVTDDSGDTETESTEKQSPMDMLADAADMLADEDDVDASASDIEDMFIDVVDQIDDGDDGGEMDADSMDEEKADDDVAEKSTEDANLAKGSTGSDTTATAKAAGGSKTVPSFQELADEKEQQAREN
jgi:hypothetical protein